MAMPKIKIIFIIFVILIAFTVTKNEAKPKTCKAPSRKRPYNFYNQDDQYNKGEPLPKHSKPEENQNRNPFGYKTCDKVKNIHLLNNLASIDFSNENVYGYHKEKAEDMFENQQCKIQSFNNDKMIFQSMMEISNNDFFNTKSDRFELYKTMVASFEYYNKLTDKRYFRYRYNHANTYSYISYFVFTLTKEVEQIVKNLKKVHWNQRFKNSLTETDYQILKSNLAYVGSGRNNRPFKHIVYSNYLLSKQFFDKKMQSFHTYLAKGVVQKIFNSVLIVPFFGCNNYPSCLYSEQVTIWLLKNHTMNSQRYIELKDIIAKVCIEPSDPEKYVKNCFSKEAMQFVGDYNVEAGIRQIGEFGQIVKIANMDDNIEWRNQLMFKKSHPYINSAYKLIEKNTLFFKFGGFNGDFKTTVFKAGENPNQLFSMAQDEYCLFLPLKIVDFVFKDDDWIERIRFSNEVTNFLTRYLSAYPELQKMALKKLNNFLSELKKEKISTKYFNMGVIEKTIDNQNMIKLSKLLKQIHAFLIFARNDPSLIKCRHFSAQRIMMFEAAFEHFLFKKLFFQNLNVMFTGNEPLQVLDNKNCNPNNQLEIPEKFVNINYKQNSDRPKSTPTGTNKLQCPYCGRKSTTAQSLTAHIESRLGAQIYSCPVCRLEFSSNRLLKLHENTPNHRLLTLAQFVPPHPQMANDKLIAQFECPYHDEENPAYFVHKENCVEHMKTHKSEELAKPKDRLNGQDCSNLGAYTCKYCKFKTNNREFAEFHLKAVHIDHLNKPTNIDYNWKHDLNRHFEIDCLKETVDNGEYSCVLCKSTFPSKSDVEQHLVGSSHRADFENVANGIAKINGIEKEVAIKIVNLFKKHGTAVFTNVKKNRDERSFLNTFILKDKSKNVRNYFWQFPDGNGGYKSDTNCYKTSTYCWSVMSIYEEGKFVKEFLNENTLSENIKIDYKNKLLKTSKNQEIKKLVKELHEKKQTRELTADIYTDLLKPEKQFISCHKDFKNFILKNKKFILTDSRKLKENEKHIIPNKCIL